MRSFIRHHPVGVGTGAVALIAGLAWVAFGYFAVHTLFIDDVVAEAVPVFDAAPAPSETPDDPTVDPTVDPDVEPVVPRTEPVVADPPSSVVADPPTSEPIDAPETDVIVTEYVGVFESDAHHTAGDAVVLGNGTGQRFLRFENFETSNGPDVNVYLVNSSTGDVSDYIDLGDLKGNIGEQNYEIPDGVDLDTYDEVVIWCVRFGVGFGDADLTAT